MELKHLLTKKVQKGKRVWIAPNATVFGDVNIGDDSSVWFGAVIRGDRDKISIGEKSNIQDNCVIHCDPDVPVFIGTQVTVGHAAVVHGAKIGNCVLIGINSTVLNHVVIGNNCIIAANSVVPEGMKIPDNSIVKGTPAKITGTISENHMKRILRNSETYVTLAAEYLCHWK